MEIKTEKISPGVAEQYLAKNMRNRNISKKRVYAYSDDMKNGRWKLNPQPIVFSKSGELIDGQHRLEAIINSGCTIEMVVMRGAPDESRDIIDSGKPRSVSDVLSIDGMGWATNVAATAKKIVAYKKGSASIISKDKKGGAAANNIEVSSKMEVVEYARLHATTLIELCQKAGSIYSHSNINLLALSDIAFLLYALTPEDEAAEFLEKVISGIGLGLNTPELAMRRILERVRIKRDLPLTSKEVTSYFFVAFDKYVRREACEILRLPKKMK